MPSTKTTSRTKQLIVILGSLAIIGGGCAPATTPIAPTAPQVPGSQPAAAQPTASPTIIKIPPTPTPDLPTATMQPTATSLPPTDAPAVEMLELGVPAGSEANIDGAMAADEWQPALQVDLDDENHLFLMHAGGYLFLGMRGKPEPVVSICIDQGDQVTILHSSAAIGTAVYQLGDGAWELVREFEWCCRQTADSPQAQEALSKHLQEENWVANNGLRGVPEEVEFQIAMPGDSLRLAVNAIGPPSYRSVISWPDGLGDDCSRLSMVTGPIPEQAQFSQEEWVTLSADSK